MTEQLIGVWLWVACVFLIIGIIVSLIWLRRPKHACAFCQGARGGVPGNENIVALPKLGHVILCDYCHADYMRLLQSVSVP